MYMCVRGHARAEGIWSRPGRFTPILGRQQVNIWVLAILNIFITVLLYCTCIFLWLYHTVTCCGYINSNLTMRHNRLKCEIIREILVCMYTTVRPSYLDPLFRNAPPPLIFQIWGGKVGFLRGTKVGFYRPCRDFAQDYSTAARRVIFTGRIQLYLTCIVPVLNQ